MLPKDLIDKYLDWKENIFSKEKEYFEKLAKEGQTPKYIIISCVDSRVDPNAIFRSKAGEMLVHRNIANIVPPYNHLREHSGTIAAIEFGVTALNIKNIVIVGHSGCGGIKNGYQMCKDDAFDDNSSISNWLSLIKPSYHKIKDASDTENISQLEKISIASSLENLRNYPFIKNGINSEAIKLYGVWNDIGTGSLESYNTEKKEFEKI